MAWFKRIFLFFIVNLLIVVTISIVMQLLGVQPYLHRYGIDYVQLAIFCFIWGMGGAFISLGLSRIMAKWFMGVQVINPQQARGLEADLLQTVYKLARAANLPKMPEVGIYESDEVNAFATGPTKARALVAVSSGLLNRMQKAEVEGVLGHEISHVANGDMVTMTLIQGIVNAFVMFFARVIAFAVSQGVRDNARPMVRYLVTLVLEIVFSILGFMIVAYFSRWREFRADAGGAKLAGRQNMISALEALRRNVELQDTADNASVATLKISGKSKGLLHLFATHPPLEERIERLRSFQ